MRRVGECGDRHPGAAILCALRRAGPIVLVLLSLTRAGPVPAAEYAEGARAFERGDYARAIALWRSAAWVNDDIDAELQLADLYANAKSEKYVPKDVVEAYVWTFLALINKQRSHDTLTVLTKGLEQDLASKFAETLPLLYTQMTSAERREAEQRIVYILSSRGADGLYRLGEIYFACPRLLAWDARDTADRLLCRAANVTEAGAAQFPAATVFNENPVDAYAYFAIAEELGHKYAATAKQKVAELVNGPSCGTAPSKDSAPLTPLAGYNKYCRGIIDAGERLAELWEPPFEVYPKPYSDESRVDTLKEDALTRISAIRCASFQEALRELGFYRGAVDDACGSQTRKAVLAYQASIGGPVTGELAPSQAVRLIRTGAANGFAPSQFTLGYMYYYGYGVPVSYPRARTWFEKAGRQRHPYALYNLGIMYRDGLGVEVDFDKAATYFMAARDAGYPRKREIACRLKEVNWPDEGAGKGLSCSSDSTTATATPRPKAAR